MLLKTNQRGMTFVEILVAVAVMAGVSLIGAKLLGEQNTSLNRVKANTEIAKIVSTIQSHLNNVDTCGLILKSQPINAIGATPIPIKSIPQEGMSPPEVKEGDGAPILYYSDKLGRTKVVLSAKNYGEFSLKEDALHLVANPAGPQIADLVIKFKMTNKSFLPEADQFIEKRVTLVVNNLFQHVERCGPSIVDGNMDARKQLCLSLVPLTKWDPTAAAAGKCVLESKKCLYGTVMTGMENIGTPTCKPLVDQLRPKLTDIFDTTAVNCYNKFNLSLTLDPGTGKMKITCN